MRAVTVAAIPQQEYFDWASILLGVEPEYAFDLPSWEWLWMWFRISLVWIMGGGLVIVSVAMFVPAIRRMKQQSLESGYWIIVFIAGAAGTTVISHQLQTFVFTWPLCVFATYQMLIDRMSLRRAGLTRADRIRSTLACLMFLLSCLLYFLVCRRLSLVFEWVFLVGFVAAVPFSLCGKLLVSKRRWHVVWKSLSVVVAFSAFYWSSVWFLYARVR